MKTRLFSFCALVLLTISKCYAQDLPLGQWSDYLSYQKGLTVCQGGGKYYCCCSSGVFSYNPGDNSMQRFNKVTGLSDIGCSVARYNPYDNVLVIGYSNGNIDILANNQIINIPDLKNSISQGSKTVNNIYFDNNIAYVCCGQGILEIDLSQDIILNEYVIGPFGSVLNVYALTIFNDTIYAATQTGIYWAPQNAGNLNDYQDWSQVPDTILPNGVYNGVVNCGNKMYASFAKHITGAGNQDTIYEYTPGKWTVFKNGGIGDNVNSLQSCLIDRVYYMVYCGNGNANAYDPSGNLAVQVYGYGFYNSSWQSDALLDNNKKLWIADKNYGLVQSNISNTGESFYPSGPFTNSIFDLKVSGSTVYIAPGAYDDSYTQQYIKFIGISAYSNGSWTRLIDHPPTPPVGPGDSINDLNCLAIDPRNPNHSCAGSWGEGVVEYDDTGIINVYGGVPSTLQNLYPYNYGYIVRVGGVGFDTNGNLWASNSSVPSKYLSVKKTDGTWEAFDFSGIAPSVTVASKILITQSGAKWIIFPSTGILAFNDYGTFAQPNASNSVFITNSTHHGALPSLGVSCMVQDLNGAIWIGSGSQVVVFYSPDNVFDGAGDWDAQNVYVQQTGYTQYLMQNQFTSCIAVDGANRKWIGTIGGGVFLMSADGTQQILNFTAENSPLLSDNILNIAIDQQNGEVFIGTDQGLVSYRGTSTEGNSTYSNVYAYPDPVPHGYLGPIAIKNLVTNSDVKIATVSGQIVYHTVAQGGQAIWYGTNFSGERVQTGVYLVFCTSPDGSQSLVTKLLLEN